MDNLDNPTNPPTGESPSGPPPIGGTEPPSRARPNGSSPLEADPESQANETPTSPTPAGPSPEKSDDFLESILGDQPQAPSASSGQVPSTETPPSEPTSTPPDFPPPAGEVPPPGEVEPPPEIQGSFEQQPSAPKGKGVLLVVGLIVVLGAGVWLAYNYLLGPKPKAPTPVEEQPPSPPAISTPEILTPTTPEAPATTQPATLDETRQKDLTLIQGALEKYFKETGKYPVSTTLSQTNDPQTPLLVLTPKYLTQVPVDPQSPVRFYGYKATGVSFELSAIFDEKQTESDVKLEKGYLVVLKPGVTLEAKSPSPSTPSEIEGLPSSTTPSTSTGTSPSSTIPSGNEPG